MPQARPRARRRGRRRRFGNAHHRPRTRGPLPAGSRATAPCSASRSAGASGRSRLNLSAAATPAPNSAAVPGRHDPAAVQDADAIGQPLDVGEVVARQQDRRARSAKVRDDRSGRRPRLGVHPRGRLIEHDHLGPPDKGECQTEPLSLTTRQPSIASPRDRSKTDEVDELIGIPRVRDESARTAGASRAAGLAGRCRRSGASGRHATAEPARRSRGPCRGR